MNSITIILLCFGTICFIYFSWQFSLKDHRYHGIYRFFSFESILILALLNAGYWFKNPLSLQQIFSWILLVVSLFLAIHGFFLLKQVGKPEGKIENTTNLVQKGAYKYIRHPLYCSLLLLGTGIFLKELSIIGISLAIINILALYLTAKVEEKEMLKKFTDNYSEYMKRTRMFLPYIF